MPLLYPPGELPAALVEANGGNATIPPFNPATLVLGDNQIRGHHVQLTQQDMNALQAPTLNSQWTLAMLHAVAFHYYFAEMPAVLDQAFFMHRLFLGL